MRRINDYIGIGLTVLALQAAQAQQNPATIQYQVSYGESVGNQQIVRQDLRMGTNEFVFILPEGVKISGAGNNKMVLEDQNGYYFITIEIVPKAQARGAVELMASYTGAADKQETSGSVMGHEGQGIQIRYAGPANTKRLARCLIVGYHELTIEFVMNTCSDRIRAAEQSFDRILLSLRSNENGPVEIVRQTPES